MINLAATGFAVSVLILLILLVVVHKERRLSRRFFASSFRGWLDKIIVRFEVWLLVTWNHFIKYILQLHWYYSIHSVLKAILKMIIAVYTYFENVFEANRTRTKQLRSEKRQMSDLNHLQQITKHQKATALTPAQQKKMRKKQLEERH